MKIRKGTVRGNSGHRGNPAKCGLKAFNRSAVLFQLTKRARIRISVHCISSIHIIRVDCKIENQAMQPSENNAASHPI